MPHKPYQHTLMGTALRHPSCCPCNYHSKQILGSLIYCEFHLHQRNGC